MLLNSHFLEESIFAVADGYCSINLTKNLVPGALYHVIDGVKHNLNQQIGIPENSAFDDLVKAWADTIPDDERTAFIETLNRENLLKRFNNGENHIRFNYWTRTAEYKPMYAEDHLAIFRDDESGDIVAVNYVIDRTEQYKIKQQQIELENKNRQLEKMLKLEKENAGMLSALRNIYSQILYVDLNKGGFREEYFVATGRADKNRKQIVRSVFADAAEKYVSKEYKESVLKFLDLDTLNERLKEAESVSEEYKDLNGNWRVCSFIVLNRNENQKVEKALFTIRDITNEKRLELEHKRATELRLKTITDAIHGGFKLGRFDKDFTFIMVSEQLAKMLGYDSPDELMEISGGSMAGIVNHEDTAREMPGALESVHKGEMYTMHYRVRCKDGTWKNVEDRGRLITNEKGEKEFWSFIFDQDVLAKLEIANKQKSNFLFNMSHDIRTPMNAILGYNSLVRNQLNDPKLKGYLQKSEQAGKMLLSIIDNVLDMARIESGNMELDENYVKVSDIIAEIKSVFVPEAEKRNIKLVCDVQVEHEHTLGDETKLKEIFLNLASNAVKYTPSGGTVTIRAREIPSDNDGYVTVKTEIIDNGIGMSKDYLPVLFDSFTRERNTTSSNIPGTGLGMSIVKKLIELMNGSIEVESELGKGTKFTVLMSHKIADRVYYERNIDELSEINSKKMLKGKRILLAEDNELNAEIAMAILEEMGVAVDRVEDGIKCISRLEKEPDDTYDIILMDIQMPNMDGYKATQTIRQIPDKKKANIPIIAMTANAFSEDRARALAVGMNDHVSKPIDMNKLISAILKYLS